MTLRFFVEHQLSLLRCELQNGSYNFNKRGSVRVHVTAQILKEREILKFVLKEKSIFFYLEQDIPEIFELCVCLNSLVVMHRDL